MTPQLVDILNACPFLLHLGNFIVNGFLSFVNFARGTFLKLFDGFLACLFIDRGNDVIGEVEYVFQAPRRKVKQKAQTAGCSFGEPDVAYRTRQLNVAHTLPAYLGPGNLNTALIADYALVADFLVLAAVTLEVFGGAEDSFTEQAISFWL